MEQQTINCQERERIADFLALSADYIGVEPPSEHTFARWTSSCVCQHTGTPDQPSR
ncbi:hypothetical protein [Sedimenticola selenatireducens]|uniref:hypothetical protein n=1 Tax=Sedimenticola selenatireducens TaxID=191960 RepID=UPI0004B09150|nr:hypothetical protein [Sedimenticola selenatireducens]